MLCCTAGFEFMNNKLASIKSNYLEIGVFDGDSIAGLAKKYPDKKIYAIDPFIGYSIEFAREDVLLAYKI